MDDKLVHTEPFYGKFIAKTLKNSYVFSGAVLSHIHFLREKKP